MTINPTRHDIGRAVIYTPLKGVQKEQGVLRSLDGALPSIVYVVYLGNPRMKPTHISALEWADETNNKPRS